MKAQTTAIVACAVVLTMLLVSTSAITYSWWSDSEDTEITITTGSLDVKTTGFYVKHGDKKLVSLDNTPNVIPIEYDDGRYASTTWWTKNNEYKLLISGNPGDVDVTIGYNVVFSGDVDYKYIMDVILPDGFTPGISIKDSKGNEVDRGVWISLDDEPSEMVTITYSVTITIDELPQGLKDATIEINNMITQYQNPFDYWDGTEDVSWYDEAKTDFKIDSAEGLAGLIDLVDGGITFEGKTISLTNDVDLKGKLFDPIGSYRQDKAFKGTFDGQGHTIYNMSQNTWELNNGYNYGDLGLGLFGKVEDATIKNLNVDGANISGESALCGTIAAASYGDTVFENITVSNSKVADYQYYAGGIVGWASGTPTFKGITIDSSTTIAGQWGDFNNACGGIIGGASASSEIVMEDCIVECCIDTHNDVVSAYQWYTYRRAGMLIGDTNNTVDDKNVTNASAPQLTCKNVTVVYGEWSYYHYCEFAGTGYPYVRCEGGVSCDPYSNIRYGHPTDSSGNKVVDDNHTHNDGEDHMILIAFNQLYGGPSGDRYATYGGQTHDGVTIIHKIDSLGGLMDFRDSVNGGFDYSDRTVLLTSDIDLAGMEWTPIGSKNPFKGTFDGQGNTISNLKISDGSYVGLFGYVDDATISDLKVDGVQINGQDCVAAVIGSAAAGSNIKNVVVTDATITGGHYVGGIVGYGYVDIAGCEVTKTKITAKPYDTDDSVDVTKYDNGDKVGGIIGWHSNGSVTGCTVADVEITAYRDVGGIVGHTNDENRMPVIDGNTATGVVIVVDQETNYYENKPYNAGIILGRDDTTGMDLDGNIVEKCSIKTKKAISSNDDLNEAISGGITDIHLPVGSFIIPDSAKGKTLTFIGSDSGDTVIATQDDGSYEGCDYSLDGSTAVFKNITINTDSTTYTGYARLNATYENCTINGTYTLYGDSKFIDCVFNVSGDVYNIWTWGAPNATFEGCTFNSDGKALLLYGQANTKLTVKNCIFNDKGGLTDKKAAIEIGNDYNTSYTLIVNNTVVNGYEINDKGINTDSTLWANKNSMSQGKLNVVIDGVDVY